MGGEKLGKSTDTRLACVCVTVSMVGLSRGEAPCHRGKIRRTRGAKLIERPLTYIMCTIVSPNFLSNGRGERAYLRDTIGKMDVDDQGWNPNNFEDSSSFISGPHEWSRFALVIK